MVWVKSISTILLLVVFALTKYATEPSAERSLASTCNDLDSKLNNTFKIYKSARSTILDRVTKNRSSMYRDEWERLLAPTKECKLTSEDKKQIKKRHEKIITASKIEAKNKSILDIDKVREKSLVKKFCREIPKGGVLHLHPSGVLDRSTVVDLGDRNTDKYFLRPGQNSFNEFDSIFSPLRNLLGRGLTNKLKRGIDSYLKRASKEGVSYVEFGKLFSASTITENQLASWASEFYQKYGVVVRWKAGFVRVHGSNSLESQVSSLIENEYRHRKRTNSSGFEHIVGVDLYGNEHGHSALEKGQHIYGPLVAMKSKQHYKGWSTELKTTIHAGEIGDSRNPRDAMILGVDRIGHGVALKNRPVDLEFARVYNNGVGLPIEINLVSNYRLSAIEEYQKHPFLDFLRLGLPVSLSTDDEGIFETSISTECEVAIENFDIEYYEFKKMSYNSIEHAFVKQEIKDKLVANLNSKFKSFEEDWLSAIGK